MAHLRPMSTEEDGQAVGPSEAPGDGDLLSLLRDRVTVISIVAVAMLLIVFYHRGDFTWLPAKAARARLGWFGLNFVCLFVVPALLVRFVFRRPLSSVGLRVGEWRLSLRYAAIYGGITIPLILAASRWPSFQAYYGQYLWGRHDIPWLLIAQLGWGMYFFAWEFFFRGFLLLSLGERFGRAAVGLQMIPFVMMHFTKPEMESVAAMIAGVALGWWAWRAKSFIGPWLLHWLCSAAMILSVVFWPVA